MGDETTINPLGELTRFSEHVRTMHAGMIDDEITEELGNAVRAVKDNGGKATLLIEISIKSVSKDNDQMAMEFTKIVAKLPQGARPPSLMYATADGDLHRQDPRQGKLELQDVPVPARRFINVDD